MLLFAEADNYRLASSDALLKLAVNIQLVVLAVFADVPVLKPGLQQKVLVNLGLMFGFQNATSWLASIINVGRRSMEKVAGTQYAVNLLFRGLVITQLVGINATSSALSNAELKLAASTEIVLSVAQAGI